MFSLPTSITSLASAANTKLVQFSNESLAKSKITAEQSVADLAIWKEQQQDKQDQRISQHLTRTRLSEAEQVAVNEWKTALTAK